MTRILSGPAAVPAAVPAVLPAPLLAVLLAPLLAVLLAPSPASAEIRSFRDPAHDSGGFSADIGKVVVQHADSYVRVKLFPAQAHVGSTTRTDALTFVWVDTDPARRGPEYLFGVNWDTEEAAVYPAYGDRRGFRSEGEQLCRITSIDYRPNATGTTEMTVPRSCIARPGRLRVNVTLTTEQTIRPSAYAPGRQRFGPWTHVG